ncbi:hypothetical protein L6452_19842 [Arctium lappa]|uniref:Uncharacterized protein n=1 Tax=Arctium lappa TaxID=4217 RepID=A0ACB9B8Y6_ARCLA|nr:hypothetical protein L6452_19842 [Arctium lappa]
MLQVYTLNLSIEFDPDNFPSENIQRETTGVSPNPKKVLNKEKEEHVGNEAHTTDFAQSVGQDSVNIFKTFPTETLGEQSSKGPRVVNTPKEGEDRYTYDELMDTLGTLSQEITDQALEIKDMQQVILSQQLQITKLKKMLLRLVHKKKKTKFVLKMRSIDHDASKKGETTEAETEKQSPVGMESKFEGELGTEAENSKAAEISLAAEIEKAAVETEKVATETRLTIEEIQIAETLVKAKADTPKATQKAKGVEIKEGGLAKKRKEASIAEIKGKGKEKVVESVKESKKQSQIPLDEELARKMQVDLEKENEIQSAKDREIALELAKKINEEYQKSLKSAVAAKKVTKKASRQRLPLKTRQRQSSKTYLANQERRKMINFLKGAIGVPEGIFTGMSFGKLEELYKKEMAKLQGDFIQRVEVERKMKERHDLHIQQPFPENEETTPTKEVEEEQEEETLAQTVKAVKRMKTIASKKQTKRPRIEEVQKEVEPVVSTPEEQSSQQGAEQSEQSEVHVGLYMTVTDSEPVEADTISVQAPEIIHWDILEDQRKKYFRIKRMGDKYEVYSTWGKIIRSCSRSDLEEMFKVGMSLDLHLENKFQRIDNWMLFERCGVYVITIDKSYHDYYLVDKIYDHSKAKLQGMLNAKLLCSKDSEMAKIVVRRTINQSLGLDPNLRN